VVLQMALRGGVSGKLLARQALPLTVLARLMLVVLIPADGFQSSG
jgi:hypothetical protein